MKFYYIRPLNKAASLLFVTGLLALPMTSQACSSCGCTLSSEWQSQGISTAPRIRIDLRYDFLDQSQLRNHNGSVSRSNFALPNDREIEQRTINRYTTLGVDYSPNADWGVNLQLPYINRSHTTVAEGDTDISSSHSDSLGDIRVLGRYQGFTEAKNFGVQLGLKLPTGSHDDNFRSGPQAGSALDRGLQPGTGSTDLLLGVYKFDAISQDWDYFAQALVQTPINTISNYKPGTSLNMNLGLRYMALGNIQPLLQINARIVGRDTGAEADTRNSGGRLVYLSPGLTVAVTKQARLYGFVQLPIYQEVGGLQLAPRWTASVGVNLAF